MFSLFPNGLYDVRENETLRQEQEHRESTIMCRVYFLDDTQEMFEIDVKAKGQYLLDKVTEHLEIVEKGYFGLEFLDTFIGGGPQEWKWLDPMKSVKKQAQNNPYPYIFYFKVKFFTAEPEKLYEEYTRYHFFLQLRKDLHGGKLVINRNDYNAFLLASYVLQSELGDYDNLENNNFQSTMNLTHAVDPVNGDTDTSWHYVARMALLPLQTSEINKQIAELHKAHKGQTPADAEYNFLCVAKALDTYGVELYEAIDDNGVSLLLAVCYSGIRVLQNCTRINTFSWQAILTLSFKKKYFYLTYQKSSNTVENSERAKTLSYQSLALNDLNECINNNVMARTNENLIKFDLIDGLRCKSFWKSCIEHHTFFRLLDPPPPPKKSFLFGFGSKQYRYSGRTEHQTIQEYKKRVKIDRIFTRKPSKYSSVRTNLSCSTNTASNRYNENHEGGMYYNLMTKQPSEINESSLSVARAAIAGGFGTGADHNRWQRCSYGGQDMFLKARTQQNHQQHPNYTNNNNTSADYYSSASKEKEEPNKTAVNGYIVSSRNTSSTVIQLLEADNNNSRRSKTVMTPTAYSPHDKRDTGCSSNLVAVSSHQNQTSSTTTNPFLRRPSLIISNFLNNSPFLLSTTRQRVGKTHYDVNKMDRESKNVNGNASKYKPSPEKRDFGGKAVKDDSSSPVRLVEQAGSINANNRNSLGRYEKKPVKSKPTNSSSGSSHACMTLQQQQQFPGLKQTNSGNCKRISDLNKAPNSTSTNYPSSSSTTIKSQTIFITDDGVVNDKNRLSLVNRQSCPQQLQHHTFVKKPTHGLLKFATTSLNNNNGGTHNRQSNDSTTITPYTVAGVLPPLATNLTNISNGSLSNLAIIKFENCSYSAASDTTPQEQILFNKEHYKNSFDRQTRPKTMIGTTSSVSNDVMVVDDKGSRSLKDSLLNNTPSTIIQYPKFHKRWSTNRRSVHLVTNVETECPKPTTNNLLEPKDIDINNNLSSFQTNQTSNNGGYLLSLDRKKKNFARKDDTMKDHSQIVETNESYVSNGYSHLETNGVMVYNNGYVEITIPGDNNGKYGFNIKGGVDQDLPVIVSKIASNTPADKTYPRLNEGDQIIYINGNSVNGLRHEEIIQLIAVSPDRRLNLIVIPNVYVGDLEDDLESTITNAASLLNLHHRTNGGMHVESLNLTNNNNNNIPSTKDLCGKLNVEIVFPMVPHNFPPSIKLSHSVKLIEQTLYNGLIVKQFQAIYRRKPGNTIRIAKLPQNLAYNRYKDISPYDQTRVVIRDISCGTSYINANYINMEIENTGIINRYIAAQGPLSHTIPHFWQMIWEQQSSLIIMLTTEVEQGRIKCNRYWPTSSSITTNGPDINSRNQLLDDSQHKKFTSTVCMKIPEISLEIELVNVSTYPSNDYKSHHANSYDTLKNGGQLPIYIVRTLKITHLQTHEQREVLQLQYLSWPDHGVPSTTDEFVDFVAHFRRLKMGVSEPVIVHCSAGIGRTGVLILMETALNLMEIGDGDQPIYPWDITRKMRDQRCMLIQTSAQYKFVCEAIIKVWKNHPSNPENCSSKEDDNTKKFLLDSSHYVKSSPLPATKDYSTITVFNNNTNLLNGITQPDTSSFSVHFNKTNSSDGNPNPPPPSLISTNIINGYPYHQSQHRHHTTPLTYSSSSISAHQLKSSSKRFETTID